MSLNAISEGSVVGVVQPIQPIQSSTPDPAHDPMSDTASVKPVATGTPNPLSPMVLAALVAEQIPLYGSYSA